MDVIREWLNGQREYFVGAKLYEQYGDSDAFKKMFLEAETEFKRKKLVQVLETMVAGTRIIENGTKGTLMQTVIEPLPEIKTLVVSQGHEATIIKSGWPLEMDETMKALHAQWKEKFLTMTDLQSRLYEVARAGKTSMAKEKEAGEMALQILDLRDQVIALYNQRDYYLDNGQLPEAPVAEAECLDPMLWPLKLQNAQRYVRECKLALAKLQPESKKYLKKAQSLQKWESEVVKYKKLLKQTDAV